MTSLPYDIARCLKTDDNWDCPLARHCLRRIDKGRAEYQAFTAFKGGAYCDGFMTQVPTHTASVADIQEACDEPERRNFLKG